MSQFENIYDASYQRILSTQKDGRDFFEAFYHHFLDSSPTIRERFVSTDMHKQQRMLKKSFYSLLIFYGSNQADDYITKIAQAHDAKHLNIPPNLYEVWLDTLIKTVAEFDELFDDGVHLAWRLVFSPGVTYMKFRFDHHNFS